MFAHGTDAILMGQILTNALKVREVGAGVDNCCALSQ